MTIVLVILIGVGIVMVVSALQDESMRQAFDDIINNRPLNLSGTAGAIQDVHGSSTADKPLSLGKTTGPQWYQYPVSSLPYGSGPTDLDYDTAAPYHTPVSAVLTGPIVSIQYGPWGSMVWQQGTVAGMTVYGVYLHMDQVFVVPGQDVQAGQVIGLSGGQNNGGLHPSTPQYSTGPHMSFGLFSQPVYAQSTFLDNLTLSFMNQLASGGSISSE